MSSQTEAWPDDDVLRLGLRVPDGLSQVAGTCGARTRINGFTWYCARDAAHDGKHIAITRPDGHIVHIWPAAAGIARDAR